MRSSIEDAEKSYISTKKEESLYINDSSFGAGSVVLFINEHLKIIADIPYIIVFSPSAI